MFDRTRDRLEAVGRQVAPWLFVIAGFALGIVAIFGMWDPPPGGGEAPPTWWIASFLVWVLGYPASLAVVWERAKADGARREQERRETLDR